MYLQVNVAVSVYCIMYSMHHFIYLFFSAHTGSNSTNTQAHGNLTDILLQATSTEAIDSTVAAANTELPRLPDQVASPVSVIDTFDQYVSLVAWVCVLVYVCVRVKCKAAAMAMVHQFTIMSPWVMKCTCDNYYWWLLWWISIHFKYLGFYILYCMYYKCTSQNIE